MQRLVWIEDPHGGGERGVDNQAVLHQRNLRRVIGDAGEGPHTRVRIDIESENAQPPT